MLKFEISVQRHYRHLRVFIAIALLALLPLPGTNANDESARLDMTGCAANSLYITCRLFDQEVSYEECFELLP